MQALEELDYLAALDNDGNLSEMGIIMSEFPVEPQMAKTLLASCEFDCVSEVVIIAAMLTGNRQTNVSSYLSNHSPTLFLKYNVRIVVTAETWSFNACRHQPLVMIVTLYNMMNN